MSDSHIDTIAEIAEKVSAENNRRHKMEQTITATCDGIISDLTLKENDQVSDGQILLNITKEEC